MKIAIDLRSLSSGSISGVENYIVNLLDHLLALDHKNSYTLFYNSLSNKALDNFHFINSEVKHTRYPNKLLNVALKLNLVNLEKLFGNADVLFLPNLNQFLILPQTKLAITVHDLSPVVTPEFYDIKRRIWHKFLNYKKAFLRANIIFAVSEYTKLDLMRLFNVPEHKIKVVYPGVSTSAYSGLQLLNAPSVTALDSDKAFADLKVTRNKYNLPGKFLLYVSTIEPRKNLNGLLTAFEALEDSAHLVIAGRKGWKYRSIFNQINRSKKRDKIHYIGYVKETEKPKIIKLAQAVVYPSYYEGFGFVPVEAMCLGVPVIASSVTAVPEVVQDAGLLVNPYSIQELYTALKVMLTNESLRQMYVARGLQRAKEFNWESSAKQVLEGLEGLGRN